VKEAATKTPPKPAVLSLAQLLTEQPAAPPPGWIEPGLLSAHIGLLRIRDSWWGIQICRLTTSQAAF
jgi:hypothetical protein